MERIDVRVAYGALHSLTCDVFHKN